MTKNITLSSDYKDFIINIKQEVIKSRNNALKVVNKELINLYWTIGESIFKKQENSNWGDNIIGQISKDLTQEFGKGYSRTNLLYMRKFYITYKDNEKVHTLRGQISWSHHKRIIDKNNH